jgi:hypothetical protein
MRQPVNDRIERRQIPYGPARSADHLVIRPQVSRVMSTSLHGSPKSPSRRSSRPTRPGHRVFRSGNTTRKASIGSIRVSPLRGRHRAMRGCLQNASNRSQTWRAQAGRAYSVETGPLSKGDFPGFETASSCSPQPMAKGDAGSPSGSFPFRGGLLSPLLGQQPIGENRTTLPQGQSPPDWAWLDT